MRTALLLVACVTAGAASPADADDAADALELAKQGETAAQAGDFTGAVKLFKRAAALDARPEYQCNIGVAYYKGGNLPRAQLFLSLCLARGSHLDATFLGGVRSVLVSVEDTMRTSEFTPIDIVVTPASAEVTVSAFAVDEVIVGSRQIWLPVGDHTLRVTATGFVEQTVPVTATGHDLVRVPVTLKAPEVRIEPPNEPPKLVKVVDHRRGWRRAAWIATGITGAVALVNIGQYVKAWGATTDAGEQPPGLGYTRAVQEANKQLDRLNIAYGVIAACAVITAGIWYLSLPKEVRVQPTEGGATVSVAGRF